MSRTIILEDINGNEITLIVPDSENPDFFYLPLATSSIVGCCKPDGTTTSINSVGQLSAVVPATSINVLSTSGTIALADNSVNSITPTAAVTFTLPTISDNTKFHQILVQVNLSTLYSIDVGTTYFFNSTSPDLSAVGVYDLIFEYDKVNQYWVCGLLSKGSAS